MNVTISKSELARVIERPCKVASRQKEVTLACVLLTLSNCVLTAEATDLNESVSVATDAVFPTEEGQVLVSAQYLSKIVKSLPEDSIVLSGDGRHVSISCGKSSFDVPALDPSDFPGLIRPDGVEQVALDPEVLGNLLAACSYATVRAVDVGKGSKSEILECVRIRCKGGRIEAVATDTYRVGKAEAEAEGLPDGFEAVIPGGFLADFVKGAAEPVSLSLSSNTIALASGGQSAVTRAYAGTYPDVDRPLCASPTTTATVGRGSLLDAAKRAAVVSGTGPVVVAMDDGGITLSRQSDAEKMSETVEAKVDAPVAFGVNAAFLVDALSHLPAGEVRIEVESPIKPIVMRCGEAIALVMPVRLKQG